MELLHEHTFEPVEISKGYADRTLHLDVGSRAVTEKPVTDQMKEVFVGGKGFDLWLMWNSMPPRTAWDDPRNELVICSGPLGGTTVYPGSGKSIVTTISPLTGSVMDSNVGGYFGPFLKFSGYDALELQGCSDIPLLVVIDGDENRIRFYRAPDDLPENAYDLCHELHDRFGDGNPSRVSVVTAGPGARHSHMGCLNFSLWDRKRKTMRYKQAGRGGTGTVFAHKNLVAVVAVYSGSINANHPADPERVRQVGRAHSREIRELDPKQNEMAVVGTTHLTPIMNDYDLLPVCNFQYGSDERADKLHAEVYRKRFHKGFDGCWLGCTVACAHVVKGHTLRTGPLAGQEVWVDGPEYETVAGCGPNCGIFDPDHVLEMNFYCDAYGMDTISVGTATAFVMECYEKGQITREHTGGLDLHFGNQDAALELLHRTARGDDGFARIFGRGIRYMKSHFVEHYGADPDLLRDIGMESKGLEFSEYMTKESLAQQGGYCLTLKGPQHDEAWLIFLDQVHNYMPTFEQKAEALHWFPMWRTWFGLNGLCKLPWNDIVPEDNAETEEPAKVKKHVEWYADFFSGVTGREATGEDLIRMSERVYNFQRIFNLRQGYGKREHDTIPYRAMGPVTEAEYLSRQDRYDGQLRDQYDYDPEGRSTAEKLAFLRKKREERYEKLADAVYKRRGWTRDGVPTVQTARDLGIDFPEVVELLREHGAEG